jgi:hypothetical protein
MVPLREGRALCEEREEYERLASWRELSRGIPDYELRLVLKESWITDGLQISILYTGQHTL